MKKKPEDLATSYYKMLQDLHQVDKKLQVRCPSLRAHRLPRKMGIGNSLASAPG